jgi:hypothetical protein
MKLKRYLVFSGDRHYPNGGWHDFRGSYASLKKARAAGRPGDWWQIVDSQTGAIVDQLF